MAFVFGNSTDDDLYPFLGEENEVPLSPDDQALLMGVYPATTMTDFDFAIMMQQQQQQQQQQHAQMNGGMMMNNGMMNGNERNKMPGLLPTNVLPPGAPMQRGAFLYDTRAMANAFTAQLHQEAPDSTNSCSPSSTTSNDVSLRDSEDILNAPVKSLTEEEKKLRRRAQVAKSARKHRNRQKEELSRLRDQVRLLQEQMAKMKVVQHEGAGGKDGIKMEQDMITQHRKRKKQEEPEVTLEGALADQQGFATTVQKVLGNGVAGLAIKHWFHHLPVDMLQRSKMLHQIAEKRMDLAMFYVDSEFRGKDLSDPLMDIKLNSNGPDMEIKLVRGKEVLGFNFNEVADAAWNSVFNFQLDIPDRFKPYVTCERLLEIDENTRYGRTIAPLLKLREENQIVYMHSYFLLRRKVFENRVIITWESIAMDDLYPLETSDTMLRNDEIGCIILEPASSSDGEPKSLFRSVIHSTPPVNAIAEPRGKINESFLTVFCRSADILETSARNLLWNTHPERAKVLRERLRAEGEH
ncbi:TPA: hypothetical protein N0F65_002318 [Lagenidium giganteum]|uniref:BZIP domain-containing protein n=1 Tax=Lagenidium giganteum TaxID=4803 RepID=A0AAV2Z1G7_9STRA|nr:TPA: hypothetical protein N0F65_002318 [Lagenidium giganteum]